MSEKFDNPVYCDHPKMRGATCLTADLEFIETLKDEKDETVIIEEKIYKCRICGGIYKYCYFEVYQTRHVDCEQGWWVMLDCFFKVGELFGNIPQLTIREARKYGYTGEDFALKDDRCDFPETPNGLTCQPGALKFYKWILPEKTGLYDPQIHKCRRCGQLYKQLRKERFSFQFVKISGEDYLNFFS